MNTMLLLVRREFWEHRSLWIAPLVWAGIIVVLSAWLFFYVIPQHVPDGVLQSPNIEAIEGISDRDREEIRQAVAERSPLAKLLGIGAVTAFVSTYHPLGVASYTTVNGRVVSIGAFGMVFVRQPEQP